MASRFRNEQVQTQRQLLGQLIQRVADLEVPSWVVAFVSVCCYPTVCGQPGSENFGIALDFCVHNVAHHRFIPAEPNKVQLWGVASRQSRFYFLACWVQWVQ